MPLRQPPRHIQKMLDRHRPGMKLQWNPRIGYWVLTDDLFIKGQRTRRACYKPPGALVGIERYPFSRRSLVWVYGDTRTGERWEPVRDLLLNTLNRAMNGGRIWAREQFLDDFEAAEDAATLKAKKAAAAKKKDHLAEWFDRAVKGRGVFSRHCATTAKQVERDIERRRAEANRPDEEADAVANQMIAAGQFAHHGMPG
jgi:hypothetical protein